MYMRVRARMCQGSFVESFGSSLASYCVCVGVLCFDFCVVRRLLPFLRHFISFGVALSSPVFPGRTQHPNQNMALRQVHSRLIHAKRSRIHNHTRTDENVQIKWRGNALCRPLSRSIHIQKGTKRIYNGKIWMPKGFLFVGNVRIVSAVRLNEWHENIVLVCCSYFSLWTTQRISEQKPCWTGVWARAPVCLFCLNWLFLFCFVFAACHPLVALLAFFCAPRRYYTRLVSFVCHMSHVCVCAKATTTAYSFHAKWIIRFMLVICLLCWRTSKRASFIRNGRTHTHTRREWECVSIVSIIAGPRAFHFSFLRCCNIFDGIIRCQLLRCMNFIN